MFVNNKTKKDRTADELSGIFDNDSKAIDMAYKPLFTSTCACNVYFDDTVLAYADFFQLDICYERNSISYIDSDGFYRYCNTEHVFRNEALPVEFYLKIEPSGKLMVFSKSEGSDTYEVVAKSPAKHPALPADPYVALLYKNSLFLIFNSPTEELQSLGIKSRIPAISNGIFCASGRLSIIKADMETKTMSIEFLSEEIIENIFTCPVSSPVDGRPGLMILHLSDTIVSTGPETFPELFIMMNEENEEEVSYSTPLGLSIYDFVDQKFNRMSPIGESDDTIIEQRRDETTERTMKKWNITQVFVNQTKKNKNVFSIFEKSTADETGQEKE